jgi:hypothetical protein
MRVLEGCRRVTHGCTNKEMEPLCKEIRRVVLSEEIIRSLHKLIFLGRAFLCLPFSPPPSCHDHVTSRIQHENQPENSAVFERGQALVVLRIFSSSHGPGRYERSRPQTCSDGLLYQGLQNLLDRIERMRALGPEFIDITWCIHWLFPPHSCVAHFSSQERWRTNIRAHVRDGQDVPGHDWDGDLHASHLHEHAQRKGRHCSPGTPVMCMKQCSLSNLEANLFRKPNSRVVATYLLSVVTHQPERRNGRLLRAVLSMVLTLSDTFIKSMGTTLTLPSRVSHSTCFYLQRNSNSR